MSIQNPGDYYVKVNSDGSCSNQSLYSLTVNAWKPDNYELNKTYTTAKQITLGMGYNATIDNPSDQDWYKFNVSQESRVNFKLLDIPSDANCGIEIFDSTSNELPIYVDYSNNLTKEFCLRIQPGNCYIIVFSIDGCSEDNSYTLLCELRPTTFYNAGSPVPNIINFYGATKA